MRGAEAKCEQSAQVRDHFVDLGVDEKITLKRLLKETILLG
jgi:hypothetical protein